MGELGLNKIFGSILAAALVIMGLQSVSAAVFSSGGHHGHHGEEKPYGEAIKDKYAYWTEVSVGGEGAAVVEEVYDLGLLLAGADAARGARIFGSVCASCHTIEQGGADGTGPNLYGLVGKDIAGTAGFGYSSALSAVDGGWSYEQLDAWIIDPQAFARGSAMVANVKRDSDRANLIAYLAENTPGAPAFPAPLPEEGEAPAEGEPALEETGGEDAATPAETEETAPGVEGALDGIAETVEAGAENLETAAGEAGETLSDAVAPAGEALEELVETVEDGTEEVELPAEIDAPAEAPAETDEQ